MISILAAFFTGWQAYEAHKSNQFQTQQADLTIAGYVLISRSSDYQIEHSPAAADAPIVINLNRSSTILNVTAELYSSSGSYIGTEYIGDMPGCTEVNVQQQLPSLYHSIEVRTIYYDTPDGKDWQRANPGAPIPIVNSPSSGPWGGIYNVPRRNLINAPASDCL
jgi:hypothetical protein